MKYFIELEFAEIIYDNGQLPSKSGAYIISICDISSIETIQYVGSSANLKSRFKSHNKIGLIKTHMQTGDYIKIYYFQTTKYRDIEIELIKKLKPPFNFSFKKIPNGKTLILTKDEKAELKRKIASFVNTKEFCDMNGFAQPLLTYPLTIGRCSIKTYEKLISSKSKEEFDSEK